MSSLAASWLPRDIWKEIIRVAEISPHLCYRQDKGRFDVYMSEDCFDMVDSWRELPEKNLPFSALSINSHTSMTVDVFMVVSNWMGMFVDVDDITLIIDERMRGKTVNFLEAFGGDRGITQFKKSVVSRAGCSTLSDAAIVKMWEDCLLVVGREYQKRLEDARTWDYCLVGRRTTPK